MLQTNIEGLGLGEDLSELIGDSCRFASAWPVWGQVIIHQGSSIVSKNDHEWACKPGSVTRMSRADGHLSVHGDCSPPPLRPTRVSSEADRLARAAGAARSTLFGLAPDGVYQADRVTSIAGALLPHRFTLATHRLPICRSRGKAGPFGGLLSVALSLASRPVDVIDHPVLRSPDFPPVTTGITSDRPTHSQSSVQNDRFGSAAQGSVSCRKFLPQDCSKQRCFVLAALQSYEAFPRGEPNTAR